MVPGKTLHGRPDLPSTTRLTTPAWVDVAESCTQRTAAPSSYTGLSRTNAAVLRPSRVGDSAKSCLSHLAPRTVIRSPLRRSQGHAVLAVGGVLGAENLHYAERPLVAEPSLHLRLRPREIARHGSASRTWGIPKRSHNAGVRGNECLPKMRPALGVTASSAARVSALSGTSCPKRALSIYRPCSTTTRAVER
jgi:hypothetical protein